MFNLLYVRLSATFGLAAGKEETPTRIIMTLKMRTASGVLYIPYKTLRYLNLTIRIWSKSQRRLHHNRVISTLWPTAGTLDLDTSPVRHTP